MQKKKLQDSKARQANDEVSRKNLLRKYRVAHSERWIRSF